AAWAALAAGDGGAAAGQAEAAVDVLSGLGYPVFCGRALDVLGWALSSENPRRAVQVLKAAAQTFAACGAAWRRDQGIRRLRKLGPPARTTVAAVSGPSSLTRRGRAAGPLGVAGSTAPRIRGGALSREGHGARPRGRICA